ncbi:MAG TPA: hypothetical protein VJU86_09815 [Pyrinomonadaceae bacterium]|nr:hypothetical protein [Pyrinomonadaceae bacterium]
MSRHEESFQIPYPPERVKPLCADAITSLGWPISNDLGYGLVSVESFQLGFTWPATVKVVLNQGDGRMTRVTIEVSNFGFGPIQGSHVRGKAIELRERIEQLSHAPLAKTQTQSQPQPQSATAKPTRQVFVNGVLLRQDQIDLLEQKYQTPLPDGNYWYDRMCGAWGMMGGPVLCTLEPNHDIGGPLQPGASNGNTGVFINGRELHYLDMALLQRVVPMIIPGRWWLDVYGNFGMEGGPMLGNLWTLAQSQGVGGNENRSSVLSSWDRTGIAVFNG